MIEKKTHEFWGNGKHFLRSETVVNDESKGFRYEIDGLPVTVVEFYQAIRGLIL